MKPAVIVVGLAACSGDGGPEVDPDGGTPILDGPVDPDTDTGADDGNHDAGATDEPADPRFRTTLGGGTWQATSGGWYTDAIDDLRLSADLGDEQVELLVLGQGVDGPGNYPVGFVSYYRYDDPLSAMGVWDATEDGGSLQIEILALDDDGLDARWSGSVQAEGYESDGSIARWIVGDGETSDWPLWNR